MLAFNGYLAGALLRGVPVAWMWVVPELLSVCMAAGSGLFICLLLLSWLRSGSHPCRCSVALAISVIAVGVIGILLSAIVEAIAITVV